MYTSCDAIFECVGLVSKHLSMQGLYFSYNCVVETEQFGDLEYGEGEFITYFKGWHYPQDDHGRLSFVKEEDGKVSMIHSWGVQGPGFHSKQHITDFPTEEDIKKAVGDIADYLRSVRIAAEYW